MHLQMLSTIRRRMTGAAFSLLPRLPREIDRTEQLTTLEARSHVSKALADRGHRTLGRGLSSALSFLPGGMSTGIANGGGSSSSNSMSDHSQQQQQQQQQQQPSKFLELSRRCNNAYYNGAFRDKSCFPFYCGKHQVGLVRKDVAEEVLENHKDVFEEFDVSGRRCLRLLESLNTYERRSDAIDRCLRKMRENRTDLLALRGWRDECYEVRPQPRFDSPPLFKMERAATCLFGLLQYGVDLNGFVRHPEKGVCVWMQRRAKTKQTWPGRMDNFVGGGLSAGFGVVETAVKEAEEEANVPEDIARRMVPAGTVSFFFESDRGLFPNTEFVFDLELPLDFRPGNNDGEVDEFRLVAQAELLDLVTSPSMKTTSCPVTLDFLVRTGVINPDNEPNLPELTENLHLPLHHIYCRELNDG